MAYEVVMSYHLHMPSYFLGTFTEYPCLKFYYFRNIPVLMIGVWNWLRSYTIDIY